MLFSSATDLGIALGSKWINSFIASVDSKKYEKELLANTILEDVMKVGGRKIPPFLKKIIPSNYDFAQKEVSKANKRQLVRQD